MRTFLAAVALALLLLAGRQPAEPPIVEYSNAPAPCAAPC